MNTNPYAYPSIPATPASLDSGVVLPAIHPDTPPLSPEATVWLVQCAHVGLQTTTAIIAINIAGGWARQTRHLTIDLEAIKYGLEQARLLAETANAADEPSTEE